MKCCSEWLRAAAAAAAAEDDDDDDDDEDEDVAAAAAATEEEEEEEAECGADDDDDEEGFDGSLSLNWLREQPAKPQTRQTQTPLLKKIEIKMKRLLWGKERR